MRHTLHEFLEHYDDLTGVQLIYGQHLVSIDFNSKGSFKLLKAFENEKFYLVRDTNKVLVLNIIEER